MVGIGRILLVDVEFKKLVVGRTFEVFEAGNPISKRNICGMRIHIVDRPVEFGEIGVNDIFLGDFEELHRAITCF